MKKEETAQMIVALKAENLSVSAIEKQLGFSNGLISKAIKGEMDLSDDKFKRLQDYYKHTCKIPEPIQTKQTVVTPKGELKQVPSAAADKRLKEIADELNKRFGEGTVMRLGDKPKKEYRVISTGSLGLDLALGIGGLPRGRMIEMYGWESSGKSTIATNAVADAQKQGIKCLWIDAESAFDNEYAEALGVDVNSLLYSQPTCGEEALDVAERYISSGAVGLVVIDSVAALVPKGEVSGTHGESKMGLHARLMSQACRKLTALISKNDTLVIFINQLREKIGVQFGNPEVTTGGNALKFYASIRLEVRRSTSEKNSVIGENGEKEGNLTTVKVVKNKCAPPFRSAQFDIIYGQGVDRIGEIFELGIASAVLRKEGNTYHYDKTKIGVGVESSKQFLSDNEGLVNEIETKIRNILK